MSDHVITLDERAARNIANMRNRVADIGRSFGPRSPEYVDAMASLIQTLDSLYSWRNVKVWAEDDLSVTGVGDGISFGLIWHGQHRRCTACKAIVEPDGTGWTYSTNEPRCADGEHVPTYPLDCPNPGTWSFHS